MKKHLIWYLCVYMYIYSTMQYLSGHTKIFIHKEIFLWCMELGVALWQICVAHIFTNNNTEHAYMYMYV